MLESLLDVIARTLFDVKFCVQGCHCPLCFIFLVDIELFICLYDNAIVKNLWISGAVNKIQAIYWPTTVMNCRPISTRPIVLVHIVNSQ
jgi:hypothetical protein